METVETMIETPAVERGKLLKVLGGTLGLAFGVSTAVGIEFSAAQHHGRDRSNS